MRSLLGIIFIAALSVTTNAQTQLPDNTNLWVTLGTQAGPLANPSRAQPANLLMRGSEATIVDAGDGTAAQLAKISVPLDAITSIFLSHLHFDHTGGLSALLGLRMQLSMLKVVTIYGPRGTKQLVDGIVASLQPISEIGSGLSRPRLPSPGDSIRAVELADGSQVRLGDMNVTAALNTHYSFTPGSLESKNESLAFRFDLPGRSIAFTGDTGPSEAVEKLAHGVDLLISEMLDLEAQVAVVRVALASQPKSRIDEIVEHLDKHHLSPENVGKLAARASVKRLVVSHIGPGSHKVSDIQRYHSEISRNYHGVISIANDLDAF